MRKSSPARGVASTATLLTLLIAGAAAPSSASAASIINCEASALRGSILTAPPIEPATANKGQTECKNAQGGVPAIQGLPVPATVRLLNAQTTRTGSDAEPGSQKAGAFGALADVSVGLPPLPITLPVDQIPDQLNITIPVGGQNVTVNIAAQLKALAPGGRLPTELLGLRGAGAFATAACVNGAAQLNGFSQVAGLRVLGQEIPTDKAVTQTLNVIGGGTVDPKQISVRDLVAGVPLLRDLPAGTVDAAVQQALANVPPIVIPAQVAQLRITPAQQIREGDKLTQRALRVQLAIAGQSIADVVVGEASVSARDVVCTAPKQAVAQETLACTTRRLVLVDVLRRGNRVRLFGVADRRLVGRRVDIRSLASGKVVSRPTVKPDGTYQGSAPLPPRRIRDTNRARYQAQVGREKSLNLKLARRMVLSSLTSRRGKVTLAGRVVRPLGKPIQTITVKRRVSCRRFEIVKRFKPSRTGAFRVTVDAPPKSLAATYRLSTRVRKFTRNPKLFDTFTLPRTVEIR